MKNNTKVSIIMASYNHEKYIRKAIDSVLNQTFDDFELIIWDDASTDNSWEVISEYSDPRIRTYRNERNWGGGIARKAILEAVHGNYIAIQHSDDIWELNKLEKQVAFLDTHSEIGAVFSYARIIDEDGNDFQNKKDFYYKIFDQLNRNRFEWLNFFFYYGNALCHPSVLIRKKCYDDCGVYRLGMAQVPDLDMWVRLCFKYDIFILPEKLVRYRVRKSNQNASSNRADTRIRNNFEFLKIYENYCTIQSADDLKKIFPETASYFKPEGYDIDFILATAALEEKGARLPARELFALNQLFKVISNPEKAERVKVLYGFTSKDFLMLTANRDTFKISQMIQAQQEIVDQDRMIDQLSSQLQKIRSNKVWQFISAVNSIIIKIFPQKSPTIKVINKLCAGLTRPFKKKRKGEKYTREITLIKSSGLFDREFYFKNNPEIKNKNIDPLLHYLQTGWKEGKDPSPNFNTNFYLEQNLDVRKAKTNPLYHYVRYGFYEDRKPVPDAESYFYWCLFTSRRKSLFATIQKCKDVFKIHRSGSFDRDFYIQHNPDTYTELSENRFWKWRESHNPFLRILGKLKTSTVFHYVFKGAFEGKDPNPHFSNAFYINQYPDIRRLKYVNPFAHYIRYGKVENRTTNTEFQFEIPTDLYHYSRRFVENDTANCRTKTVSVITESGNELEETKSRLESIFTQNHHRMEVIFLQWQNNPSIVNLLRNYSEKYHNPIKNITVSENNKNDGTMWADGFHQATSELIWCIPQGSICSLNFLHELLPFFSDECIMAAHAPTQIITEEQKPGLTKPSIFSKIWVKPVVQWIDQTQKLNEEIQFHHGAWIFRNFFVQNDIQDKIPPIKDDDDFRNFLLPYLSGAAIAFSESTTHWINPRYLSQDARHFLHFDSWKKYLQFLSIARTQYQLSLEKIKKNHELFRTDILLNEPLKIDEFLKTCSIDSVIQLESKLNIMISIVAFTLGGGEIMPIRLANELKQMGHTITLHAFRSDERDKKVRNMLDPRIPIVITDKPEDMAMILKEFHIDVVNTHHQANQSFIASILKVNQDLHSRIFHVGTSHGMYENFTRNQLHNIFERMQDGVDHWTYVADKNLLPFQWHGIYDARKFTKIPNGMKIPKIQPLDKTGMGIPSDSFVACLASRAIPEKGWLQAIEAITMAREISKKDIHLLLIGDGEIYQQLMNENTPAFVHLLGFRDNPCDYFSISDICLIPSYYRSESAPLTLIEALLCHIPIISSDIGDVVKMLTIQNDLAGDVFELQNWTIPVKILAQKISKYATDNQYYQNKKMLAELKSHEFDISNIALKYLSVYQKKKVEEEFLEKKQITQEIHDSDQLLINSTYHENLLCVSIIVPNFNHAKYLKQRLDCIYHQTYRNFEVLLLDDCSTDNSREILQEYMDRYPRNTRLLFNDKNSGGVYHQWAKGILNSTSEYCWIAESDDFCELNFLEKVMPAFKDPQVKLSYCQYSFVNPENVENSEAFFNYVGTIDKEKWRHPYVNDSSYEVETALGIKNTIPNASGMVFRKPQDSVLLEDNDWLSMYICGDWIFYLHILQNGKIAYTTETRSYFRFHSTNTSVATYSTSSYYKEHEKVACTIRQLYDVSDAVIKKNYENIHHFFTRNVHNQDLIFEKLFDLDKVLSIRKNGK